MDEDEVRRSLDTHGIGYDILKGPETGELPSPGCMVEEGFGKFLSGGSFENLYKEKKRIAIIVNDRNRPTPTHLVMEYLMNEVPWMLERSEIVIATGSHKEPSDSDLREILGKTYPALIEKIHVHNARDKESHSFQGRTKRGTELYFDKVLEDKDLIVFVNSVEPHYFAGFTGGRKSLIPGVAYHETIEKNHSHALEEGSRTTALEDNPVNEDMMEACRSYLKDKDHLSIQLVQAPGKMLTGIFIGDIFDSFDNAVAMAKTRFCSGIGRLYDLVIAMARPPMDRTLYQAQKAIENGKLALKEGGTLILVAECEEGIGQSKFWELLTSRDSPEEVLETIKEGYRLGYHKAARIVQLVGKSRLMMVSRLPPDVLGKGFIEGYSDIDTALERVKETMADTDALLIPDGTVTVPQIKAKVDR